MNRSIQFAPDEFYHLYNRGVEKRTIFKDKNDYKRFLTLLYFSNGSRGVAIAELKRSGKKYDDFFMLEKGERLVNIGAYCIMPNHFHILVQERRENGVSEFMKKLSTGYSMYFNLRYKRTGSLFESTFKATHVDDDRYLKYLYAYIHLNPVKIIDPKWKENGIRSRNTAKRYLDGYQYSSYLDFMGHNRLEGNILGRDSFPSYFSEQNSFQGYIDDWLDYTNNT